MQLELGDDDSLDFGSEIEFARPANSVPFLEHSPHQLFLAHPRFENQIISLR